MSLKRRIATAAAMLIGTLWAVWRDGHIFALEVVIAGSCIVAVLCTNRTRVSWFLWGTGFGAVLGSIIAHMSH